MPAGHVAAGVAATQARAPSSKSGARKRTLSQRQADSTAPQQLDAGDADGASSLASGTSSGIAGDVSSSSVEYDSKERSGSFDAPRPRDTMASHPLTPAASPRDIAQKNSAKSSRRASRGAGYQPNPTETPHSSSPASDASMEDAVSTGAPSGASSDDVSMSLPVPRDFGVLRPEEAPGADRSFHPAPCLSASAALEPPAPFLADLSLIHI